MSFQADGELTAIEQQMLAIVKRSLDEFEDAAEGTPIPQTLIQAYDKVHGSILRHIAKGSSMDMNQVMKNPHAWLLQNDRMRAQVLKLIEQQQAMRAKQEGVPQLRAVSGETNG